MGHAEEYAKPIAETKTMNPMLAQYSARQHSQCGYRPQTSFSPVKCFIILFFFMSGERLG